MFRGARLGTGGFSPVAEAGLWVDMRAKPDSAASLDRAAQNVCPSHNIVMYISTQDVGCHSQQRSDASIRRHPRSVLRAKVVLGVCSVGS